MANQTPETPVADIDTDKQASLNYRGMALFTSANIGASVLADEIVSAQADVRIAHTSGAAGVAANIASWAMVRYNVAPERARYTTIGVAAFIGGLIASYNAVKYGGDVNDVNFYAGMAMGSSAGALVGLAASELNVRDGSVGMAEGGSTPDDTPVPANVLLTSQTEGGGHGRAAVTYREADPAGSEQPTRVVPMSLGSSLQEPTGPPPAWPLMPNHVAAPQPSAWPPMQGNV